MSKKIRALQERKAELLASARTIVDDNQGELSEELQTQFDAIMSDVASVTASIDREKLLQDEERSMTALELDDDVTISGGAPRIEQDPQRGFATYGEFCSVVANASINHEIDQRLRIGAAAPSTYGGEGVGSDGGFAVPPGFSSEIWGMSLEEDSFVPLTDNMPISGNSMTFPSDETTPWGTEGVRAYWDDEAAAATETKPKLNPNTMRLNKLTALVPVSDELLADATGLPAYLTRKTAESIRYKTNDAIMNGNAVGRPSGILSAGSLVAQAKVTSQTADTIVAENVTNMFSRLIGQGQGTWVINPDAWGQLPLMTIGDQPVFIMPNGLQSAPGGFLLGRPVIMSDTCQTLGDQGDINFVNFSMYRTITKAGGIETATSMHLYFDASAMAFRAVFRIAGQPILGAPVTPPNSSVTRSGMVTLAARA
jgi:HK97 family phage major capsid protein